MPTGGVLPAIGRFLRTVATGAALLVVVVLLILWLAGYFHPKIESGGTSAAAASGRPIGDAQLVEVRTIRTPVVESAVGTVQTVHEVSIASKILAKVLEVNASAGQRIAKGDVLVRLDDADLRARLEQSRAAVDAARAARDLAKIELERLERLAAAGNATALELDRGRAALKSAEAEVSRAEQLREEAAVTLEYATVRSPIDGQVVDKRIEAGDTAAPGQVLVTLFDPTRMQLIASVRESLTQRLAVGQNIAVQIDAIGKQCEGLVREIVPEAESASRTFLVKVTGPCPPGVYAGMFGRVFIPLDEQELLVIPRSAVRRVGQLDIVEVAEGGFLVRRVVQLGREHNEDVEVLSGLSVGEQVAADPRS